MYFKSLKLCIIILFSFQILVDSQNLTQSIRGVSSPLLFLHIPKNGGTAVAAYIKNNWAQNCAEAKLIDSGVTNALFATPEYNIKVSQTDADCYWMTIGSGTSQLGRSMFTLLATHYGVRLRYGTGHVPFGFCNYLQQGCEYTTVIREPFDRLISQYHYVKERYPQRMTCDGCETFQGYVESLILRKKYYYGTDNMQTRMLSGDAYNAVSSSLKVCKFGLNGCDIVPFMQVNETHFEKAKQNLLNYFPVIGILSDMQAYQALMYLMYNYQPYKVENLRQTSTRKMSVEDLDEVTRNRMHELLHWDLKLFEFAKELIQKRVSEYGSNFSQALEYVQNYDANLPIQTFKTQWDSSRLYGGHLAKALTKNSIGTNVYT